MSFSAFNLNSHLSETLTRLDYHTATPIQSLAIPEIMAGHDIIAHAQTGTGKTAAFMLPIIDKLLSRQSISNTVSALILVPTRELAQQVAKASTQYSENCGLSVACLYGGANIGQQEKQLKQGAQIVVATPGRLLDHLIKGTLSLSDLAYLVFDEADRMLDMGFMGEIKRIMRHVPLTRQTLLFSATVDEQVLNNVSQWLNEPKRIGVDAPNTAATKVEQLFYAVDDERKRELIAYTIGKNNWHQVLVFTRTKHYADELAKELNKDGLPTTAIHGDKSQGARNKALEQFRAGELRVLVATDVAARGIDIPSLDYVINAELPYIAEDYVHRIGRTGRAGKAGTAISLVSLDENWLLEEIEVLLDERLTPQWLTGFEPDLTREPKNNRKNTAKSRKQRDKKRILGQRSNRRRKNN
ncbi:DEAD/DEAH box helicase [Pseudoalteromonas sp. MMG024]|uniref:DEAD/DEAH box helicase n=1 Tax=Pseudoalteromonas sp. MMG024 TaxID=2909980 RepID=UPI001F20AA9F|nr:DEAD/DEAH box helicase [Pseudoalteromonas sp. MMG024]MCF6455608.1 DEAD/DEAH box helicase [Pseudoalteromonas sp. MMG024]